MRVSMVVNNKEFENCEKISRSCNGWKSISRGIEFGLISFFNELIMSKNEKFLSSMFILDEIKSRIQAGESVIEIANNLTSLPKNEEPEMEKNLSPSIAEPSHVIVEDNNKSFSDDVPNILNEKNISHSQNEPILNKENINYDEHIDDLFHFNEEEKPFDL